ncbi:MAG: AMP-binding protein [Syntrophobacteraceae bacterium]|jgi:feruloyl-CoA synthase
MKKLQMVNTQVDISEREDGSVIIQNRTPLSEYPANLCTWLHQHGASLPDKPFLLERDSRDQWKGLTFAEMLKNVNKISNGLLALGVDASRPVAILSQNCINMALFQLAAMQIGLAVTPISYAYSARSETGSHIKHILDVAQPTILVMSDSDLHMPKMNQWDLKDLKLFAFTNSQKHSTVLPFESLFDERETLSPKAQSRFDAVTPGTLAKIQFTSGSTNLPKGVLVTHGMQVSNQVGIAQMWPYVNSEDVVVDWLPWNHTFGGNKIFNMMLMHGGTFYIDNGNPTPAGIEKTIKNIKDVKPSIYFGVPLSFINLLAAMKKDRDLKAAFFKNLKFNCNAAAALDQTTYEGIIKLSVEACGAPVPFLAGWGCTETSPTVTLVWWEVEDTRIIGLPIPGVKLKLAPDPSGKREIRVWGPNVTTGYMANPEASRAIFDEEGYLLTRDAGKFLHPERPMAGLVFDGRTSEDFKLATGVWVNNARLRGSIHAVGQPFLLEVVPAALNRRYLTCLIYPNIPAIRKELGGVSADFPDDSEFLKRPEVTELFRAIFKKHNAANSGGSSRIEKFLLLSEQARFDRHETTDKGYINQNAVLTNYANLVNDLYEDPPPDHVMSVDEPCAAARIQANNSV